MQIKDLIPWGRDRQEASRKHDDNDNPVSVLQHDINRVFDEFWSRFDRPVGQANGMVGAFGPSTDISETDKKIEVSVELPGVDEKDVDVALAGDMLTIRGEKKEEKEDRAKGYYFAERSYGSFSRTVPLPPGVDTDKASAEFKKGVLTVTLPKTPEAQAQIKRIEVKGS